MESMGRVTYAQKTSDRSVARKLQKTKVSLA